MAVPKRDLGLPNLILAVCSEENIKCLYRCENKSKRRQVLANILDCPSCDSDEDDMKISILLDFYSETIHFACERGFSWQQGLAIFELMKELFNSTLGELLILKPKYIFYNNIFIVVLNELFIIPI
jgi:hypothetical protein